MAHETNPGDYIRLGWKVFPCHSIINGRCSCGRDDKCESPGKHPRTRNGVKDASDNLDVLRAWWELYPGCNWGLACGKDSDVFVIDIDDRKGGFESFDEYEQMRLSPLPITLKSKTGGGGRHLFFKYPTDGTRIGNRVGWLPGVDVRSDGGYVILPPGNHISGGMYDWLTWGTPVVEAPGDLVASVGGAGIGGLGATKLGGTDELIAGLEEGGRDDQIFRMACRLRRQLGDNARAAVLLLVLETARNSNPPFPENEARAKVEQAFKQDHTDDSDVFVDGDDVDSEDDPLYRLTDMGNRDRFVRAFGDDFRFVAGIGWHRWTDLGWQKVDDRIVTWKAQEVPAIIRADAQRVPDINMRARFLRWANDSEAKGRISNIVSMAETHPDIMKTPDDFDNIPKLLACRNGMVNLENGTIRNFTRDDLFTRNTNIIYDPSAKLDAWDRFLVTTTNNDRDLMDYLQMAAGYSLSGSIAEECFFIISGPTASGKSTFMAGLEGALGKYADVTSAETFMKKFGRGEPREEVVKFAGARVISTEELPEGERFDDAFLKRITGGSPISARYLYQEGFTFNPQFKLWMATNHDPITSDSAMFRRIKRVPFLYTIPEDKRDRKLKAIIKNPEIGGQAVLAWAVRGAIKYFEQGRLIEPLSVQMATSKYQSEQDSFTHFINETYSAALPTDEVKFTDVYSQYVVWCKNATEKPARRPQFAQKLADRNLVISTRDNGDQYVRGIVLRMDVFNTNQIPFT